MAQQREGVQELPIISFKKAQLSLKRTRPKTIWPVAIFAVTAVRLQVEQDQLVA
jgi:hypothetical protein